MMYAYLWICDEVTCYCWFRVSPQIQPIETAVDIQSAISEGVQSHSTCCIATSPETPYDALAIVEWMVPTAIPQKWLLQTVSTSMNLPERLSSFIREAALRLEGHCIVLFQLPGQVAPEVSGQVAPELKQSPNIPQILWCFEHAETDWQRYIGISRTFSTFYLLYHVGATPKGILKTGDIRGSILACFS